VTDEQKQIEQLERRVATLENMVRRLTFVASGERVLAHSQQPPQRVSTPAPPIVRAESPQAATDLEQWFGQRGLLAVGVIALLAAAAFFLKYAIDRGWIAPLVRALLAIVAGIAVAAWGHQRITRGGMRRYGASLIGAGGGLAFLGLWAAAGPYGLVDRRVGILLLATTTVAVTLLALHHQVEGLAIWALAGAYLAPLLLQPPVPNHVAFLGYIEVVGLGTGILAYTMSWRRTFDLALFGYLVLAAAGGSTALATPTGCWLVVAAALLALHVTNLREWPEARLGVVLLAWVILGTSLPELTGAAAQWLSLAGIAAVTGLLFWQHLERNPFRPDAKDVAADQLLFLANPLAFVILGFIVLNDNPALLPAALGAAYLLAGWQRRLAPFLIMGLALQALAVAIGWPATSVTIGWTALALVALLAERQGGRPGGRHAAVGLASAAFGSLFTVALFARGHQPVFTDPWALALYAYIAGTAVAARWWGSEPKPTLWKGGGAEWMWMLCGTAVFAGWSIQFWQAFGRIAPLAGDLALSVWWLVYAGAVVWLGFELDRKMIRSAGLLVAGGAGLKIVLYDLSTMEALYRVASFFALALIALAVAYAYNRKARVSAA